MKVTKEFLLEIGGWRAMKEGRALYESGKVGDVKYDSPLLVGSVRSGTSSVNARLKIGERLSDVENLCSCRQAREYGTICPHVIAVGLRFIEQRRVSLGKPAANGNGHANARAKKRVEPPRSRIHYIPRSDAADTARILELSIILPPKLDDAWKTGSVKVVCKASVPGERSGMLDSFCSEEIEPYAVSDEDVEVLNLISRFNQGGFPSMWDLESRGFADFFESLIGHPRVTLGKDEELEVRRAQKLTRLSMDVEDDGTLTLALKGGKRKKTLLSTKSGQWSLSDGVLEKINNLPMAYHQMIEQPVQIPRDRMGDFYQRELPALSTQVEIEVSEECQQLEFETIQPGVHIRLDGMLSGLSCQVHARYEDEEVLIFGDTTQTQQKLQNWKPDPEHRLRYFIRDVNLEQQVRREVIAAGFAPGQRQPEFYTLSSESRVGAFLANVLPAWKARWSVEYSPRMDKFLSRCDFIKPQVAVESSGEEWLSLDVTYDLIGEGDALSTAEVQRFLQMGSSHQRLDNGRVLLLPTESLGQFQEMLRDCDVEAGKGTYKVNHRYSGYLSEALQNTGWEIESRTSWEPPRKLEAYEDVQLAKADADRLRNYQKVGVNWMHYLSRNKLCGILADEMGLGKTIQTLMYLQFRRKHGNPKGPILVVCPTSLVHNWIEEAERFVPDMKTLMISGSKRKSLFGQISEVDIVVTSYALLRRDLDRYLETEFDMVVLDEAQAIKNRSSQNAKSAKALRADHRMVLTGTPIENSLLDLWSILDFLMPGYLGSANDFKDRYEIPIGKLQDANAQARLKQRVQPFILRRTKTEVAKELPAKMEQIAFCELTKEQKSVYQAILEQARRNVFNNSGRNGQDKRRIAVLTALMRLRQVCCHLGMLPDGASSLAPKGDDGKPGEWKAPSTKMDYFMDLLDQAVSGEHRVLVFSQFVSLLQLVKKELEARKVNFCYLDGTTVDRKSEIDRFQNDSSIPVFLISLKAGGTGMNLTGADTVVHFDPWWNPAVEDQATARAHRIGQTRIVNSYKLIARGTVEEKIVQLQEKKKDLVSNTLVSEESFVRSLTWEELQGLLE